MAGIRVHVRDALLTGAVGGFAFGCREALVTLSANAFVQPGQYALLYVAVPILAWVGLGMALLLPCALLCAALGRPAEPSRSLPLYATILALAGTLSITIPWVIDLSAHLAAVGWSSDAVLALLWLIALALAVGAALVAAAAAAWQARRVERPLRTAATVVLVGSMLCLWPVARFFATDWKWGVARDAAIATTGKFPDVVLISIDTLRADHLGAYAEGHSLTPRMDQLAKDGVLFEHAITSSPWTLPAMASVMTGLYPHHHGAGSITNRRDPLGRSALSDGAWTLAGALHAYGFRTHAIVTNPYLALRYGVGQGFDSYENVTIESEAFLAFAPTTVVRLIEWLHPDVIIGDRGDTVSGRAARWLAQAPDNQPFFLWVHYVDPHPPYSRAGATRHKSFRSDSLLAPAVAEPARITLTSPDVARLRSGEIRLSPEQKAAVHDLYRDEVRSVDAAVGMLLDALDRRGRRQQTLVICLADHGEEFWEHGGVEHGHTVYEELVHVPLLVRWPGHLPPAHRVAPTVRIVDVAPTVLDLLGLPPAQSLDGASVTPLLNDGERAPRVALIENMLFAEERIGVRTPTLKYVHWENGKEEVYDLGRDPGERVDLVGSSTLLEPLRRLAAGVDAERANARAGTSPDVDGGTLEALRALGYVH